MARRRTRERTIFLPWERQGSLLRRLGLSRVRPFLGLLFGVLLLGALWAREQHRTASRATRATLLVARRAVDAYRADKGECPRSGLEGVVAAGYLPSLPRDAWGHPIRLTCPSRRAGGAYDLSSDGPDGEPGGLDRIE
jgi:general secretion pathway protein G